MFEYENRAYFTKCLGEIRAKPAVFGGVNGVLNSVDFVLFYRLDMYRIFAITIVIFDVVLSFETRDSNELNKQERREKRQFSSVIPNEVKGLLHVLN